MIVSASGMVSGFIPRPYQIILTCATIYDAMYRKRQIERKREQILRDSRETMRAYKKGLAKRGTVDDLLKDLESD